MFFKNLLSRLFPSVGANEPLESIEGDPMAALKEKCNELDEAQHLLKKLEECTNRVKSKQQTTETCSEELMEYLHVVDNCVAKDLFKYLK